MNNCVLAIEELIKSGEFEPGAPLPPLPELAQRLEATEEEVAEALTELIYEGAIERVRPEPLDTFRMPPKELWGTLGGNHSITKEAKRMGQAPGVEILRWQLVDSWPGIQRRMALATSDKVQIMERLRTADGVPIAIETSYFPAKFYPGITQDLFTKKGKGQSSFAVMQEKFGLISQSAHDEVTVVCLEEREANYLEVEPGTPVLQRFRVTLSDKGVPIKASRAVWLFRAAYQMGI